VGKRYGGLRTSNTETDRTGDSRQESEGQSLRKYLKQWAPGKKKGNVLKATDAKKKNKNWERKTSTRYLVNIVLRLSPRDEFQQIKGDWSGRRWCKRKKGEGLGWGQRFHHANWGTRDRTRLWNRRNQSRNKKEEKRALRPQVEKKTPTAESKKGRPEERVEGAGRRPSYQNGTGESKIEDSRHN